MIKVYRKTATIKAEQFDNSIEMAEKYHVEYDGAYILPFRIETPNGWLGMKVGDWIETSANGGYWPIADDVFKQTYAELPVIPKLYGYAIEEFKNYHYKLSELFADWDWNYDEQELIARAWLDGYVVEEDE